MNLSDTSWYHVCSVKQQLKGWYHTFWLLSQLSLLLYKETCLYILPSWFCSMYFSWVCCSCRNWIVISCCHNAYCLFLLVLLLYRRLFHKRGGVLPFSIYNAYRTSRIMSKFLVMQKTQIVQLFSGWYTFHCIDCSDISAYQFLVLAELLIFSAGCFASLIQFRQRFIGKCYFHIWRKRFVRCKNTNKFPYMVILRVEKFIKQVIFNKYKSELGL